MYDIIFLDIDGTLRDEVYGIPDSAREAVYRCRQSGRSVCLCTGRTIGTIQQDVAAMEFDGVIAGGGCYIAYGGEVLKDVSFAVEDVQNAARFLLKKEDTAYAFEAADAVFMNREAGEILADMNERKWRLLSPKQRRLRRNTQPIAYKDTLQRFSPETEKVSKLCLWANEPVRQKIWGIFINGPAKLCCDAVFGHRRYWELIRADSDKGAAVRQLCARLGIPLDHALAFGDGQNDIDMFRAVGARVAMRSGDAALFPYADAICEAPRENGIYLEFKRRNLIRDEQNR